MSARPTDVSVSRALWGAFHTMSGRRLGGWHPREMNHTYRPGAIYREGGLAVRMASGFAPYARSYRAGRVNAHRVRAVYIAWQRGVPRGRLVVTWCGTGLRGATLSRELPCVHEECHACVMRVDRCHRVARDHAPCCAEPVCCRAGRGCCA